MNSTSIEWCNRPETRGPAGAKTWNPIRARFKGESPKARSGTFCTRISPGCQHCYASTINKRFGNGLEFTVPNLEKIEFFVDERILEEPLTQKKPCTIFVGDMFDLFHEGIPHELLDRVFAIMAHCSQTWNRCTKRECDHCPCDENGFRIHEPHTFQVLTKRAEQMSAYLSSPQLRERLIDAWDKTGWYFENPPVTNATFPLSNVWCGVSVEDQQRADERIPLLLQTPAAVRFLSVEPQLEEIDFQPESIDGMPTVHMLRGADWCDPPIPGIDWLICGGESGSGARPFNLAWAESLLAQCRAAGVPFFMKQVGSFPYDSREVVGSYASAEDRDAGTLHERIKLKDRKGGNPSEWPEALRVREFPTPRAVREAVSA